MVVALLSPLPGLMLAVDAAFGHRVTIMPATRWRKAWHCLCVAPACAALVLDEGLARDCGEPVGAAALSLALMVPSYATQTLLLRRVSSVPPAAVSWHERVRYLSARPSVQEASAACAWVAARLQRLMWPTDARDPRARTRSMA